MPVRTSQLETAVRILRWRFDELDAGSLRSPKPGDVLLPLEGAQVVKRPNAGMKYPVAEVVLGEGAFQARVARIGVRELDLPERVAVLRVFNTAFALAVGELGEGEPGDALGVDSKTLLFAFAVDVGDRYLYFRDYRSDGRLRRVPLVANKAPFEALPSPCWMGDGAFYYMPEAVSMLMGARRERVLYVADGGPTTGEVAVVLGHEALVPEFDGSGAVEALRPIADYLGVGIPRVRTDRGWRVGISGPAALSLLIAISRGAKPFHR